ncbi:amino acid ABC transporter substrate-binding protein [Rhodococcus sp. 14C212]|uniref:ABC transporter substrate-binding protein n=1 Tax=Rhodococcus sp. 14C212 TaxID=2711209 RepID=UPI0013EBCAEF|nr:ABC transporter substrate-binding protein [Rhodococcus sp. 14C212]NGP08679.1 amino acid ABC transporter substrate-binding protein [Rhodococcus sp. 14C212]
MTAGFIAPALAACGGSGNSGSDDAISIAIVSDQTGSMASIFGISGTNGTMTAIHAANEAGGINGRKIETQIYDAASAAGPAQTAARSAIASEPDLILNMSGTISTNAAFPLFEQSTVPVLSIANAADQVLPPRKFFWGFNSTADQASKYLVEQTTRLLGGLEGKRVVWEALQTPVADAMLKATQPLFEEAGAITVDTIRVEGSLSSFASQAAQIVAADPDVFIPIDSAGNMTIMGQALATAGYDGPIVGGGDSLSDEAVFATLRNPNFHAARAYQPPAEGSEVAKQVQAAGTDSAGGYFGSGYTVAQIAITALTECGSDCSGDDLVAILDGFGEFEVENGLASGPLLFGDNRRAVVYSIASMVWDASAGETVQSGELIQIENEVGEIQ